ncbi:MAG: tRNA preQ1(34) S-adenosylmethionine ribosyltransferase-isomerase QueA [Mogibacterium sp.]|jgi:S-adenosylmethionine:tRNA ribosyltransferase-isomerase|nr:tRNA preQ1(34) S-adenosylmethionine ribosyltransferase-isomerase QueA [Mogibacterium sp.]
MRIEDFDYELPEELIAQTPMEQRDKCRLMVLDREHKTVEHRHFYDILNYVNQGDCLVLNDSRVIPARMYGTKESTGAHIEMLLIKRIEGDRWECMVRPGKRLHDGDTVLFEGRTGTVLRAEILGYHDPENGTRLVEFSYNGIFMEVLEDIGSMPLPPYITRPAEDSDKEMYQTVYSRIDGSVAAPTAGLHFTKELLQKAQEKGVRIAYVTLHVGIGTFRPVKVDVIEEHKMHFEECSIDEENASVINETIEKGGRIISVGTTSTRTLESMAVPEDGRYRIKAGETSTGIFIYPGYSFKVVDALITNFHLPKSTLIMLVSALYDREEILKAYKIAVEERYRFFSYGDAMLIK